MYWIYYRKDGKCYVDAKEEYEDAAKEALALSKTIDETVYISGEKIGRKKVRHGFCVK